MKTFCHMSGKRSLWQVRASRCLCKKWILWYLWRKKNCLPSKRALSPQRRLNPRKHLKMNPLYPLRLHQIMCQPINPRASQTRLTR